MYPGAHNTFPSCTLFAFGHTTHTCVLVKFSVPNLVLSVALNAISPLLSHHLQTHPVNLSLLSNHWNVISVKDRLPGLLHRLHEACHRQLVDCSYPRTLAVSSDCSPALSCICSTSSTPVSTVCFSQYLSLLS